MLKPIVLLKEEHDVIDKMVKRLKEERKKIIDKEQVDPDFIETTVDFFKTYADRTHHGKEEDILFAELEKKQLKPKDKEAMNELVKDHKFARKIVQALLEEKEKYVDGEEEALSEILNNLETLIELYPAHIEEEDKIFFDNAMEYFSEEEQDDMLDRFYEFDRGMIHEKYKGIVS